MGFQLVPKSVTLSDLERHFWSHFFWTHCTVRNRPITYCTVCQKKMRPKVFFYITFSKFACITVIFGKQHFEVLGLN